MNNKFDKKLEKDSKNDGEILELIYKIIEDGNIINLKNERADINEFDINEKVDNDTLRLNYEMKFNKKNSITSEQDTYLSERLESKAQKSVLNEDIKRQQNIENEAIENNKNFKESIIKEEKKRIIDSTFEKFEENQENQENDIPTDEELEENEEYQAYLNFKKKIADIGLKKLVKKVTAPNISHKISIYTHENDLLVQAILINIIFLAKPLFSMSINMLKTRIDDEEIKLQIVKNYLDDHLESIKKKVIEIYISDNNDILKKEEKNKYLLDEYEEMIPGEFTKNAIFFDEMMVNSLLMWLNLNFKKNNSKNLKQQILSSIDYFFEKNLEDIFKKITI